ncbi:U-box domain-containing protein 52-like [Malania oleifera]|uniref:U-box domain-containing protein 52-like n=1 Tax=Malania oleifera TaxID=397392 RepID=UPI0025AE487C|nr:U-box domain-containing protein 52-like [Malania oleifera]
MEKEDEEEEGKSPGAAGEWEHNCGTSGPEIVEVGEDSRRHSIGSSRRSSGEAFKDVYVAVGKEDMEVVKWALDHAGPGARIFLVHVFPSVTYIPTPVGKLLRSQLNPEQVNVYVNEESNRRRKLLQKYIRLCTDAKVTVDTLLLESTDTAKSILELIPIVNITNLVMGTKRPPSTRRLMKGLGKAVIVQKNAPDFCEVTIVFEGNKVYNGQQSPEPLPSSPVSSRKKSETAHSPERKFFECVCFSGKFN